MLHASSPAAKFWSPAVVVLAVCSLALVFIGLSGIQRGDELEGGHYVSRQVVWLFMGCLAAVVAWSFPYRWLRPLSYPGYVLVIGLLVLVFVFPARNGARRWIPLGPLSIQPSELAKIAVILALGEYLMFRKNHRTLPGLIPPFVMAMLPVLLILKEPDLGTALLFFPVLYAMLYIAGAKRRHLLATALAGLAMLPVLWMCMSSEQKSRITAVFQQRDGGTPESGDGYHLFQSKQMLALGGAFGSQFSGDAVDDPAAYLLPAGRTDFVYCLVGERWGLPGTLGTLLIFSCFVAAGLQVAGRTRDPFGRLLATGIVTVMTAQVLINTSMTVGLTPITGLTLPLMSYGGSSLVTTFFCIGLLLNVARSPGFDVAGQPFQFHD